MEGHAGLQCSFGHIMRAALLTPSRARAAMASRWSHFSLDQKLDTWHITGESGDIRQQFSKRELHHASSLGIAYKLSGANSP